jgi:hypothetical protein
MPGSDLVPATVPALAFPDHSHRFLDEDTACSTFDEENQTTYVLPAVPLLPYQRPNSSSLMSASFPSLGTAICARLAGILERVDACTSAPRIRGSSSSDSGPPIMMGGRARGRVMGRDVKGATEEDLITWGGGKRRPPEAGNALAARTERRGWVSQDDKTRDVDPSGKDTSMVAFLDGGEPNRRLRDFGGVESPIGMKLSSCSAASTPAHLCEVLGGAKSSGDGSRVCGSRRLCLGTTRANVCAAATDGRSSGEVREERLGEDRYFGCARRRRGEDDACLVCRT